MLKIITINFTNMKNYNYLASELCKFGLNKKEAEIYLILLKIGYSSVQKIAEKVDLSRPTVYRTLEKLKKRNLINTVQKGQRNYFIAGSPDAFLNIIKIKKRQAEEQEREFLRIINALQNQYSFDSKENVIEIYDQNQKSLVLDKLVNCQNPEIKIISNKNNTEIEEIIEKIKQKFNPEIEIKKTDSEKVANFKDVKNIIITDKIFIFENDKISIIKNQSTIKAFKLIFELF
jgi:sugar-specific transcriptional regulator TrmB